jgi:hypothetical protein
LRGEVYLLSHDGNRATAELQKFIDHRGLVGTSWVALAGLGLSRTYATENDSMKAPIAYQDFDYGKARTPIFPSSMSESGVRETVL